MRVILVNNAGQEEVDPYNTKGKHDLWFKKITENGAINYQSCKDVSPEGSEYITKYILDLYQGRNLARGSRKGRRSYNHLVNSRSRLRNIINIFEERTKKTFINLTEDEILSTFNAMRDGTILNKLGKPHLGTGDYAKAFAAFWRWYVRIKRKEGIILPDICENLDTGQDRKPKWAYFTLQGVESMAHFAPSFYYRALIYFLFDSGIRAPKELMNVRAIDITPIPNTNCLHLYIREETSKTFGRKIKLMICSDIIKQYMKEYDIKGNDFLFPNAYVTISRVVAKMGYNALRIGRSTKHKDQKIMISGGITLYDFRHNSVCHYLPIYKSENQMKYRYGWHKSEMIHYYSEFLGMKDTINEEDMLIDTTKTELEQQLQRERQKIAILEEQMQAQKREMEERMQKIEQQMLQKITETWNSTKTVAKNLTL